MGTKALFPDMNGPMVTRAFERACRKADVPNLRLRGLRHTVAVLSGDGRPHPVGLWAIQQFLGHKNLRMTERCAHLSADYLQQAG